MKNYKTSLGKEVKKVIIHLGLTFHRILEETDIKISIGSGRKANLFCHCIRECQRETDIDFGTFKSGKQTIAYDYEKIPLNVKVEYVILPHIKTRQHKNFLKRSTRDTNKQLICKACTFTETTD